MREPITYVQKDDNSPQPTSGGTMQKIVAVGEFILVQQILLNVTKSGIIMFSEGIDKDVPLQGVVVSVGSGPNVSGLGLLPGDKIIYQSLKYPSVKHGDSVLHFVGHSHVVGLLPAGQHMKVYTVTGDLSLAGTMEGNR